MSGALAARPSETEAEKGRVSKTKVKRYWPGRAPEFQDVGQHGDQGAAAVDAAASAARERVRTEVAAPVIVRKADDPRLRRLMAQASVRDDDKEEALQRRREIRAAEVVVRRRSATPEAGLEPGSEDGAHAAGEGDEEEPRRARRHPSSAEAGPSHGQEEEEQQEGQAGRAGARSAPGRHAAVQQEEEDEEAALRRRQAVRERLLQQQRELEQAAAEEEEEDEDDESEYETDSEDEEAGRRLLKPVFVPKQARETMAEREALEQEAQQQEENEKKRLQERKFETQQLVRERIAQEEAASREATQGPAAVADIDTDDEKDPIEAYESWKQRELQRIKRDREEKEKQEAEARERERLRNMTEEERAAWERANPKEQQTKEKKKLRFMQKYWHKGAYFQSGADDERGTAGGYEIFERDFSAPTGEDRFDKQLMPKVMQVKNFGRMGRTKYTHLVAEDTTFAAAGGEAGEGRGFDDPMLQSLKEHAKKRAMAGARPEDFAKPKKFKA